MASDIAPVLSVIIIARNGPAQLRRCLVSLRSQPRFRECEVHVVTKFPAERKSGRITPGDENTHWHPVPKDATVPSMRSLGIAKASAGLVALLEDDCTLGSDWLASLLSSHQSDYPAVGGAVEPGDFSRGIDWAVYYCEYARFLAPFSGIVDALPGNNVAYRADSLDREAVADGFLDVFFHQRLREAGNDLLAADHMVVFNNNRRRFSDCTWMPFHHGRAYAAQRFSVCDRFRRLLYIVLSPLLPIVKLARTHREIVRRRRSDLPIARALPWIMLFYCSWSVGECLGYLAGAGNSCDEWR